MYLSRIAMDIHQRQTLRALDSPEILHGMVESCFSGERQRNLWRIDMLSGVTYLLLLSQDRPDFTHLSDQIGDPVIPVQTKDYDPLLNRIVNDSTWRFRLTANPVVHIPGEKNQRGKVEAVTVTARQREWLIHKAQHHGFQVALNQFDVVRSEWKIFRNKGKSVSILSVTFEGVLKVTSADDMKQALIKGIGRGKAYGMGMLTVMPYG